MSLFRLAGHNSGTNASRALVIRRINKCILSIRLYSLTYHEIDANQMPADSKELRNKEAMGWVQQSLLEPAPVVPASYPKKGSNVSTFVKAERAVDEVEWQRLWEFRFRTGELKCVTEVIKLKKDARAMFTPSQMLILLTSLKSLRRFYDIHRLYQTHKQEWNKIDLILENSEELCEFLKIMILTASRMHNYEMAEHFFRKYIKQPALDPVYINMGLKALLENKDNITARQFFEYMLNNQEVFPVTHGTLRTLLIYINHADDLLALKSVFESWLLKGPSLPSKDNITLVHKQFLKFDEENSNKYWDLLLSHPRLKSTHYKDCGRYTVLESIHKYKKKQISMKDIDALITCFDRKERSFMYLQLLNHFVEQDDYQLLTQTMKRIKQDSEIELRQFHHSCMLKYFVKNGRLEEFISYLEVLRKSDPNGLELDPFLFFQIWECAFQSYPNLRTEIEKAMKSLFDNRWYKRTYPWISQALASQMYKRTSDTTGDDTFSRRNEHRVDIKLLNRVQKMTENGRYRRAKTIILDQARLGIRPNFQFYYALMKFCINKGHFQVFNMLDTTLRSTYRIVPIKVDILKLRANLYKLACQLNKDQDGQSRLRAQSLQMIEKFIRENKGELNFQNYIQLAMIASRYKGRYLCDVLLSKAVTTRDPFDGRSTYIVYRSLLAFFVRLNEPKRYLSTLKKLNLEPSILVTKYLLNTVKYNIVYFNKQGCKDIDAMLVEYERLRKRYAYTKIDGREALTKLMSFLRKWLDHDVHQHQITTYHKQLELEKQCKQDF